MINWLHKMNQWEIPVCLFFNRINHKHLISQFFAVISRLGNGVFWYSLIAALPFIYGFEALQVSAHMLLVAGVVLLIYKVLKTSTHRVRPYRYSDDIFQNVAALDQFSFPSGHTMHAVSFTIIMLHYYPEWYWLLVPFTSLVALSRLVLGLHYPSDVLAGIAIGSLMAYSSLLII